MAKQLNVNLAVTADTGQAKAALQSLQSNLKQLSTSTKIDFAGDGHQLSIMTKEIYNAQRAAGQLRQQLTEATNVNTGRLDLTQFSKKLKESGMTVSQYRDQLLTLGPQGERAFTQLAQSIMKADIPLKRTSKLFSEFKTTLMNTARWQFSSSMLHGFMGALSTAYSYAQDLNKSLNNIQIVTQASNEQMAKFAESANRSAKSLSTTTTKYTDAALIYYQQGLGDKEVIERTNATIKMANVTGQSAQKVSDQMTAIWNNFDNGSHSLEYYADVITALGAATASSSEEISKGLEKFASIADTVGLSYENATAALATITATTRQSADTVGTGLRTLFSRFQSLSLGETLEDNVDLTKYSKALKTIGVEVLDANGNLRTMDNILEDMGAKWQSLTDAQKMATAQTVGGVRQYTTLMALMENFDFYKENQQVALGSEGTLQKQQAIYEQSWEAASKRVRASAESIYEALLDDKFFIKLTNLFSKILDGANLFIKGIGGMKGALLGLMAVVTSRQGNEFAGFMDKIYNKVSGKDARDRQDAFAMQRQTAVALQGMASNGPYASTATGTLLGEQGKLYEHLIDISENLGEVEAQRVAAIYDEIAALNESAIAAARNAEKAQEELEYRQQIYSIGKLTQGHTQQDYTDFSNRMKNAGQMSATTQALRQGINSSRINMLQPNAKNNSGNILYTDIVQNAMTRMRNNADQLNNRQINNAMTKIEDKVSNLKVKDGVFQITVEEAEELIEQLDIIQKKIDRIRESGSQNKQGLFKNEKDATEETKRSFQTGEQQGQADYEVDNAQHINKEGHGRIEEAAKPIPPSFGQSFSNATSAVMSLGMAISTVQSLMDTWNNSDLTIGEKLATTATSGTMALMMLGNAYKMLTSFQTINTVLTTAGVAAQTALTAVQGASIPVVSSLAGALAGLNAPLLGFLAIVALVVAAIAVIGFIGKTIANAITTPAEHLANLAEQTEQAKKSAEDAKQAYDDLLTGRSTYNSLLDELEQLTAGTLEFQEALLKANTAAQELISNNNLTPDDYEVDNNGAIRIKPEALNRAQKSALEEANDKQQQYLLAQSLEKNEKFNQSNMVKQLGVELSTNNGDVSDLYSNNKEEYDAIAKRYGYNNGSDFISAYKQNRKYFNEAEMIQSGVAAQNQMTLQNALLKNGDKKELTGFDNLLIGSLATNSNFWSTLDTNATKYNRKSSGGAYIDLDDKNTTLTSLENEYKAVYSDEAFEKLTSSEEYKNLTDKADQKKYLANAIKEANANRLLNEKLDHLKELSNRDEIKQYKKAEKMTGEEILALRAKSLKSREKINELDNADDIEAAQFEQQLNDTLYQRYSQASAAMLSTAVEVYGPGSEQQKQFGKLIKDLSLEQIEAFNTSYSEATTNFGKKTGEFITKHYLNANGEINKDFTKALSKFDLNQGSISAIAALKSGRSSFGAWDESEGNVAYELASAMKQDVGEKGLFDELYKSEDFQDSLKDLQKEFQKTGKISTKSIMDAAKSSQTLDKWLKASGIGAQGLADALETLGSGNIENISEALLRAFGAAGQLESSLAKTYDHIDNFEAERSIQDVGKFYKGLSDTVKDGFTSGFLMDKPVLQAFEDMFGSDKKNEYLSAVYKATDDRNLSPGQISNEINTAMAPEIALMQSIQSRGNLSGVAEYALKQAGPDSNLAKILSYNSATQQVTTTNWDDLGDLQSVVGDQEQFIKTLMKEGNISESLARDFANEYGATNGNIQFQWRKTNVSKGLEEFANYSKESNTPIMGADIRAFYDQYGDIFSSMSTDELKDSFEIFKDFDMSDFNDGIKSADDLVQLFRKNSDKLGSSIMDLGDDFNFATDNLDDLKKSFKENNNQEFDDYFNTEVRKSGGVRKKDNGEMEEFEGADIGDAINAYTRLGATIDQAYEKLDEMHAAGDFTEFTASIKAADGSIINLTSSSEKFKQFCADNGLEEGAAAFDMYRQQAAEAQEQLAATEEQARIFAKAMVEALTSPEGTDVSVNFDDAGTIGEIKTKLDELPETHSVDVDDNGTVALIKNDIENLPKTHNVTINEVQGTKVSHGTASGYNNGKGFAGGKHIAGQYEGLAETGELGPELWIRDGQPYLTGIHGRTKIYVKPDDQIFTAAQTKEILRANPSMQDIPGFSVGYGGISWGGVSGSKNKTAGKASGSGANADNAKTSDYSPERYHLITRQLKDLQREYDELSDIKDNAYGADKLKAIDAEIDATNRLIEGQKALVKEAEDYLKIDTERLKGMLAPGEFQVDQNGNLLNFEELQEKYRKAAEENKDDTHSKDVWKALEQYEETLDKFYDAQGELRQLIYQEMEARLEKITTKVELKINFDEKELKLLDHYIKHLDDDIYNTAKVLALTETRLSVINKKIKDTKEGIKGIFDELSDKNGNKITKANGSNYTLDDWLKLTDEQRKSLNINDNFGTQLEEYAKNLLDYIEELEEFKTKGVEEVGEAFSELNTNIESSIELFDHYNSLLENLKNIVELQGIVISDNLKNVLDTINDTIMKNIENNIVAEREHFNNLVEQANALSEKINSTTDPQLKKAYEEQLKEVETATQQSVQNLTGLWQQGLEQVKDKFDQSLEDAVISFEKALSDMYGSFDQFSKAWDDYKKLDDFYVKDYEKYYQMAKMSRAWTKDIENAFKNGSRHTKGMQKVLNDLNAAREEGIELTSYDLDVFAKRYEYEKALMELEDARNDKSEVRLQRDANGNWGYVYTSSEDEDSLLEKQQAVEDKLYDLQSAEVERVKQLQEEIKSIMFNAGKGLQELYASGASQDVIDDYIERTKKLLLTYHDGLQKALDDAGMTVEEAKLRYGEEGFEIVDSLGELLLSQLSNGELTIEQFLEQFLGLNNSMKQASEKYQEGISSIDKFFQDSGEDLATVVKGMASWIGDASDNTLIDSKEQIKNAQNTFTEILRLAGQFEADFMKIYKPIIDTNEDLLQKILAALATLNGSDWTPTITSINTNNKRPASGKTGMYTGTWPGPDTEENGRLAFLHQKELVLNKDDTKNFLASMDKMLNMSTLLKDLEMQTLAFEYGFKNIIPPEINKLDNQVLDQYVTIEANFPSVTEHQEIEMAFDNLVNKASQYINRKNMSSMTFQDSYIHTF